MATSRAAVSLLLHLSLPGLAATVHAMEIRQFDKLDGDDQIDFVDQLAENVQAASRGALAARVQYFFEPKHPGETISGMGRFEMNLALAHRGPRGISGAADASGAPRTWWEQNGYPTYHDAVRATCLHNTTAAFPTWCN